MIGYWLLSLFIVISDRLTKSWALQTCLSRYDVTSWFSCSVVFNRGISWSFLHSESQFGFALVTTLVIIVTALVAWHAWLRRVQGQSIFGEALVIAGSLSNIYDRFAYGGVVDFIAFEYYGYSWPLFNIADIAVVLGVCIMVYEVVRS